MKILHLAGWYYPESIGGTEVYVRSLASRQREHGHAVTIAAPLVGLSGPRRDVQHGVDIFRYSIPDRATRDEAQGRTSVRGVAALSGFLAELKPDVAHFHSITTGLGLNEMVAAKNAGAKVVVTSHLPSTGYLCQRGTMMRWGKTLCDGHAKPVKCAACALEQRGLDRMSAWSLAWLGSVSGSAQWAGSGRAGSAFQMTELIRFRLEQQRLLFTVADKVVVLNEWSRRVALENGAPEGRLVLNRLGYSSAGEFRRKPPPEIAPTRVPIRIGYLGRLAESKGVTVMMSAIARLASDVRAEFEIRGIANDAEGIALSKRFADLAKSRANVRLEPAVPHDGVMELLASFDVLCVPSTSFENGPTVVIEAHAAGTPVIGTGIGAMLELIDSGVNGLLVPPGDAVALAQAFHRIARNPGVIDDWRNNLPQPRTMAEVTDEYEALYQVILSDNAPRN